jgi:hypothetical protein
MHEAQYGREQGDSACPNLDEEECAQHLFLTSLKIS